MGDSVLLPQIRNLKNVSDLRRKQRQQRQALQTGIKVDRDAEDSFKLAAQQIKQNMLPLMPNELMLQNAADDKVAAGLLIQRLPIEGEGNLAGQTDSLMRESVLGQSEDFSRISILTKSIKREELLGLDAETILHRL